MLNGKGDCLFKKFLQEKSGLTKEEKVIIHPCRTKSADESLICYSLVEDAFSRRNGPERGQHGSIKSQNLKSCHSGMG